MKNFTALLFLLFLCIACKKETPNSLFYTDPKFAPYIAAYTSGLVSSQNPIKVVLQSPIEDSTIIEKNNLLKFSPKLKGTISIAKGNTLVFTPEEPMAQDQLYEAELQLKKLQKVPDSVAVFPFQFQTLKQNFDLSIQSIQSVPGERDKYEIKGMIYSNDHISNQELEAIFHSKFQNKKLKPTWVHKGNQHEFTFQEVRRGDQEKQLEVMLDGEDAGAESDQEKAIKIPKKGVLKLIQIKAYSQPEQYIAVNFSQPISEMDFEGLFSLENENIKSIIRDGNIIKVYPAQSLSGKYKFTVWNGIKDIYGNTTKNKYIKELELNSLLPKVEFVGSGNIVVPHNGVNVPFRAIGLKSVQVKVSKIFKNNIHQFFQFNQYAETDQMTMVAREIYTTKVHLNKSDNFNSEQSKVYAVDIQQITEKDPSAMYNVEISFTKEDALMPCEENESIVPVPQVQDPWDYQTDLRHYYNYFNEYPEDYNWRERDNPCANSYYTSQKFINKNVLATNMGLTAKISADRKLHVALADLKEAQPISQVQITAFDLQHQIVGKGKTNGQGLSEFPLSRKPFLIHAEYKNQSAYLRVDEGSVLNYSNFDIDGTKMEKGIQGYVYGERGVWRPGDSIFLTFVAHSDKEMPKEIPARFELYNSDNQLIDSHVAQAVGDHFYRFSTQTKSTDKTGNYYVKVNFAGVDFRKTIKIETIKPNRLKIETIYPSETLSTSSPEVEIQSRWLTGGKASGFKVVTETTFSSINTSFKGYKNYHFEDPSKSINTEPQVAISTILNSEGAVKIPNSWHPQSPAPGMLKVAFFTKVFEKGGDFSSAYSSTKYSPYTSYVGFKMPDSYEKYHRLQTSKDHEFQLVALSEKGKPVEAELEINIYKINQSWWYNSNASDMAYYVNDSYHAKAYSKKIKTLNGKASYHLKVDDNDWGNYFIHIKNLDSGHSTGRRIWIDEAYGNSRNSRNSESAAFMVLQTNKNEYKVGETAKITLPNSLEGRALLSFENGTRVLKQKWVTTENKETQLNIPITEELAPNFYLNVSLIQPHQNTKNDLPIRLYGVKSIKVENPKRQLSPSITAPKEMEPNQNYSISVKEKSGKPMTYTLAVVDEGLLDITQYKTPDIYSHFNHKQSLGVKTWDLYQYVLGAYGGRIENVFAIGGDQALQQSNKEKINRFKPVVTYLGPFHLGKNKSQKHSLKMPNYIGSAKVMVVAANDHAFGSTEANITVKKPLMTLTSLPRTLSPGDEVTVPINVFVENKSIQKVNISLETNSYIQVVGTRTNALTFNKTGEQMTEFRLKIPEKLGKASLKINAKSGNFSSSEVFEIEVRAPNPILTENETKEIRDQLVSFSTRPKGMESTNRTVIEISSLPISNFSSRINSLIHYPHGCVEQTVSGMFPQLYLSNVTYLSDEQMKKIQRNVNYGIEELSRFQLGNGGLGYWPGDTKVTEWGSVYALHFLKESKEKGFQVPDHLYSRLMKYVKQSAKNWDYYHTEYFGYKDLQAYRLYVLVMANEANLSEMNRLKESRLNDLSYYLLATSYYYLGKKDIAQSLSKKATYNIENYIYNPITYGSKLRDRSMILTCLSQMNQKKESLQLLKEIGDKLSSNEWYSTQTLAMSLLGISTYIGENKANNQGVHCTLTVNGKTETIKNSEGIYVKEISADAVQNISIKSQQKGLLFATVSQKGIPVEVIETSSSHDLKMSVGYFDLNGKSISVQELPQNTDFEARVRIVHPGYRDTYYNMALSQIFPSGWEIVNMRVFSNENTLPNGVDYQDYRDDRVYSYFDLNPSQEVVVSIRLNATYKGEYIMPAVHCEAMYDASISATQKGMRVRVK